MSPIRSLAAAAAALGVLALGPAPALAQGAHPSHREARGSHGHGAGSGHTARHVGAPDSGEAGSACVPVDRTGDPAPAGLDTTALGATAPAGYELGQPSGLLDRLQGVRRVMVFVHGGGWYVTGAGALADERSEADQWRAAGWATANLDYRACGDSLPSVLALYDLVRAHFGAGVPICLSGISAGGQLALMVAALRPDVACVIATGAPTDLWTISRQATDAASTGTGPAYLGPGGKLVKGLATAAFGRARLRDVSPAAHAADLHARLLLAGAADDPLIPLEQARELASLVDGAGASPYVDVAELAPGPLAFAHGKVSHAALDDYSARVARLVAPFGTAPGSARPSLVTSLSKLLGGLTRPRVSA